MKRSKFVLLASLLFSLSVLPATATSGTQGVLGTPVEGTIVSGVGVISGYHCASKNIEVFIDGASIGKAGAGTRLLGTQGVCGRTDTGFSLLYNFNNLANGQHTVSVNADDAFLESHTFYSVQSGGTPWLSGASKTVAVADFPTPNQTATLEWVQSVQNFVVTDIQTSAGSSAAGVYDLNLSNGYYMTTLLEDGQFWGLYGRSDGYIYGMIQGNGVLSNTTLSSSNVKDFYYTGSVSSGSVSASFGSEGNIGGTLMSSSGSKTFTGAKAAASSYDYNSPAALPDVAGSWSLASLQGQSASMTIGANGAFSGLSSGCSFGGAITPRPSGKNVFNVTLVFGGSPCALPRQSATGIAVSYLLSNGSRQLIMVGVDTSRNNGTALFGVR